jgi:hypothetical protein
LPVSQSLRNWLSIQLSFGFFIGWVMLRIVILLLAVSVAIPALAQTAQPPTAAPAKAAAKKSPQPKGTPASQPTSPAASGPCIGVISTIGTGFGVKKVGFTVFGNEFKEIAAQDFRIDDLVVERVQAAVGRGYVVRKIPVAQGALESYRPDLILGLGSAEAAETVKKIAGSARCERYFVMTKGRATFTGNQTMEGIGIITGGASFASRTEVHAIASIRLLDGRTFAVVKNGGLNQVRSITDFKWPETPEAVNNPAVRAAARGLVAEELDKTLARMLAP